MDQEGVSLGKIVGYGGKNGAIAFLTVEGPEGVTNLSEGMTIQQRREFWATRRSLVGAEIRYRRRRILLGDEQISNAIIAQFEVRASTEAESYEPEWTPMRSATFPAALIEEKADDRGDVYVYVNGLASYESFDDACARLKDLPAGSYVRTMPEPTIADLERLTRPRTFRQWLAKFIEGWRETSRLNKDIAYFRSIGHPAPLVAASNLAYLNRYHLADFRDFASKRRLAGIRLEESKKVYTTVHLHPKNSVLSGEERAHVKKVIEDMEPEDAFTPAALALDERELAAAIEDLKQSAKTRSLSPAEKAQFQLLKARR